MRPQHQGGRERERDHGRHCRSSVSVHTGDFSPRAGDSAGSEPRDARVSSGSV
jgi:hypothetical protein